ncbi:hypothetical protein SAMN05660845_1519 [Flavobacterium swingsii]|jgi:hypothetical protein|uniref:FUSC family protein n=1 Tax=Flavobacterium swingsii TaxID=498292 RepID=A0A1I0Y5C9_9FLAO|nr:hypothetical protein [Flavobacterium swingsii]SFB08511.1 hypothetical protein SAMN05660845_1519 [Flavobacterium swingsii]
MTDKKDYSNLSLEELVLKQTALTKRNKTFVIISVFSVVFTFFAIYKKSSGAMHVFLILGSMFFLANNSTELKKVQIEIEKRKN